LLLRTPFSRPGCPAATNAAAPAFTPAAAQRYYMLCRATIVAHPYPFSRLIGRRCSPSTPLLRRQKNALLPVDICTPLPSLPRFYSIFRSSVEFHEERMRQFEAAAAATHRPSGGTARLPMSPPSRSSVFPPALTGRKGGMVEAFKMLVCVEEVGVGVGGMTRCSLPPGSCRHHDF